MAKCALLLLALAMMSSTFLSVKAAPGKLHTLSLHHALLDIISNLTSFVLFFHIIPIG